ncbi:hypothetical protein B0H11DRAFT_1928984 [Mycena galericulata]|nr:hypothetical protein B0H11DRAFT_1928984 [Mycena galericulata]
MGVNRTKSLEPSPKTGKQSPLSTGVSRGISNSYWQLYLPRKCMSRSFLIPHPRWAQCGSNTCQQTPSWHSSHETTQSRAKAIYNHIEIGAHKIFEELTFEKEVHAKAVASLNTVRRKGKAHIHITELEEDDCIEE